MAMRLLLVEDDVPFRESLCDLLNLEGFAACGVGSIASFKAWRSTQEYDVLIVDRNLPDGDGLEAVRLHRTASDGPVVVLSAIHQLDDRLQGINADVDYYLPKPVVSQELFAILRRLQRKSIKGDSVGAQPWQIDAGSWHLYSPSGTAIELTRNELLVLACFVEQAGIMQTKGDIIRNLGHDPETYDPRRLEILVRRLRKKIDALELEFPMTTIYGEGYSFNAPLSRR